MITVVDPDFYPSVPADPTTSPEDWQPATVRILADLARQGFDAGQQTLASGYVRCRSCGEVHDPAQATEATLTRVEGGSDPGDGMIIASLRWPEAVHGCRGVLVLGYGPTGSVADLAVLERLGGT